jgi:NAD(P)-dependent dehydrogenase (short-subunit alcohol dehydrogenase family)
LTQAGARALGRQGINMNCVSPGVVRSPMTQDTFSDPAFVERHTGEVVFGRAGEARDIAYPIVLLCSDRLGWVVGADLNVSAGQVIY